LLEDPITRHVKPRSIGRDNYKALITAAEKHPIKLYPFTRAQIDDAPSVIMIDPAVSGGHPVGLATEIIAIVARKRPPLF